MSSSFKQKLKYILNDSSSIKLKNNSTIDDQQFDQYLLKTYKKIKRHNTPQLITYTINATHTTKNRTTRNFFFEESKNNNKYKKGISPNTAERMMQTFSLVKNKKEEQNSMRSFGNNKYDIFFSKINKFLNKNSKIKRKIQRDCDYIIKDINNTNCNNNNYKINNINNRFSTINKTKSFFENNTIKNNFNFTKNKIIHNMRRIFEISKDNTSIDKGKGIIDESCKYNFRKGKLDFANYYNQFRNRKKYLNFKF